MCVCPQTGEATPTASGRLEVQVVGGELLHSKMNGDGYVDTPVKLNKVTHPSFSGALACDPWDRGVSQ
jgi:hypothetical protein